MFKSKKVKNVVGNKEAMPNNHAPNQVCNNIAPGTHIEGKFITSEDVRLDGRITGDLLCHKKLVMGEHGHMNGDVVCEDSSIRGKIFGTLKVKGLLHLLATAKLEGKIMAKKMVVDEGASYSGDCLIGEQHVK
jgi:cytoskeletal protein CcmA (bactofilin family)